MEHAKEINAATFSNGIISIDKNNILGFRRIFDWLSMPDHYYFLVTNITQNEYNEKIEMQLNCCIELSYDRLKAYSKNLVEFINLNS